MSWALAVYSFFRLNNGFLSWMVVLDIILNLVLVFYVMSIMFSSLSIGNQKSETKIRAETKNNQTVLTISKSGGDKIISLERDDTVLINSDPIETKLLTDSPAVVLIDTYYSQPGGAGYCGLGQEKFLRVISSDSGSLRETLKVKINYPTLTGGVFQLPSASA